MSRPLVSIVVPVLSDFDELVGLLDWLRPSEDVELIVALGEPPNAEVRALRDAMPTVTWLESRPGRGRQMNRGAAAATGEWLLFLHVDGRLAPEWLAEIRRAAATAGCVGGSFRFALDSPAIAARVIERGVRWRVRWFDLPYGDQALFVRRAVFDLIGGYREMALMEDIDLVRRMRRAGRLWHSRLPVRVSARRWERDGWIRRTAGNLALALRYAVGVHPDRLAEAYYGRSPRARHRARDEEERA